MSINRNNYEAYLLDLSEGNLSDELRSELNSFLAQNRDLDAEIIEDFSLLDDDSEITMDKDLLNFDSINDSNRKHFFIAFHEGDLTDSEQHEVMAFVSKNKDAKEEFETFSKLYLKSTGEVFEDKESLRSIADTDNSKGIFYWSVRIAAILIIGFIINSLYQNTVNNIEVKYTRSKEYQELKPTLENSENINFADFFLNNKNQQLKAKNTASVDFQEELSTYKDMNKKVDTLKANDSQSKPDFVRQKQEAQVINRNPSLERVVASLNKKNNGEENDAIETLPVKKIETPPSLLAYIGDKAKEKKILTENGRPDIVSLLNKGSNSISGQDILAKSETEESNSTIFKLGSLKIERITNK